MDLGFYATGRERVVAASACQIVGSSRLDLLKMVWLMSSNKVTPLYHLRSTQITHEYVGNAMYSICFFFN
jgi:hypothetical protein